MKYSLTSVPSLKSSDCLVVGVLGTDSFPFDLSDDKQHAKLFTRLRGKLKKNGDCVWQTDIEGSSLLLIHCGVKEKFNIDTLNKRISDIATYLFKEHIHSATICMPQLADQTPDWQIQHMLLQIENARYQLLDFKTDKECQHSLDSVQFYLPGAQDVAITNAHAIAQCITYTRTLANLPANVCTPAYLAQQATELAEQHPALKTKVFDYDEIKKMGMGTFLAVAQGSKEPPYFIEIQYKGKSDKPPVILVGKGVTFDSGGLSLKPSEAMPEMKYDMAGAASVLGTLKACALLKLPIHVVGLIPCTENMLSGGAIKPGDIVTSMSGQTVEIINTDAEGRLILADALTYAERFNPAFVIDIATLTGAVIVALGGINTGLMTNDESLAESILTAARTSNDKTWRLPLDDMYQDAIDSPLADMLNANFDRTAGSITAACFLSRFTKKYRWAHLDVAGTAWISGKKRNATGRPVPLLIELLRHVADSR